MNTRTGTALIALVCAAALAACGGGGGGDDKGTEPKPAQRLEIGPAAAAAPIVSGAVQTQWLVLRNTGTSAARQILLSVEPGAEVLHLPLGCEGQPSPCVLRPDGSLEIAELAAGASLRVQQRLRIKPGFSGPVGNNWSVRADAETVRWRQELQAQAATLKLAIKAPTQTMGADGREVLSYELTLSNPGPDEARDVEWRQFAAPGMDWLDGQCSASAGAQCPAQPGERIKLERLPKGGSLTLTLRYGAHQGALGRERSFLGSEVALSGAVLRAEHRQAEVSGNEGSYRVFGLDGEHYRLQFSQDGERGLRFVNERIDRYVRQQMDVTGSMFLGGPAENRWNLGRLHPGSGLIAGAMDLGTGRRFFLGAREFVTDLAELEGRSYNLLGSSADSQGRPLDAFARSAQFKGAALELCRSTQPTSFAQCPQAQLQRWEVALVGNELELVERGSGEVRRLHAARTPSGPVLILSQRHAGDGSSEFWLGLPAVEQDDPGSDVILRGAETTFGNASGLAALDFPGFNTRGSAGEDLVKAELLGGGVPEAYLRFWREEQGVSWCLLSEAAFARTAVPALRSGTVSARNGQRELCWSGPSYHARTPQLRVLLGAKDGPLMGRWLFAPES